MVVVSGRGVIAVYMYATGVKKPNVVNRAQRGQQSLSVTDDSLLVPSSRGL
jgi:hypothetical protein